MNSFASGPKNNYYGKGDIIAYRLNRTGDHRGVFGAMVKILIYGDSFMPTYTTGDNTGLVATDSMKNFVQRETANYAGHDLEAYVQFLADKFLAKYPQAAGAQVSAVEIPYSPIDSTNTAFAPAGPEVATACVELIQGATVQMMSGLTGFRLLRLNGSAFKGFVRDEYTTLPNIANRPLHMWLDVEWTYTESAAAFNEGAITKRVREIVREVFAGFESGSIQQIIYQIGQSMLTALPALAVIHLEANNRTWDTILEHGDSLGVYTEARPPYGCLGLTLRR